MAEPMKITPPEMYALLLQHPGMQVGKPPPSLDTFQTWDQERQQATLDAFAHFNPGIWLETIHNRKIVDTESVEDGQDITGAALHHIEIVWGESLNLEIEG